VLRRALINNPGAFQQRPRFRRSVVRTRHTDEVADSLLSEIERDALDDSVPVGTALRKCVALGGRSGSEALRDWATQELQGYGPDDDLPEYRIIAAPLLLDGIAGNYKVTREQLPPMALPDFAREHIKEEVQLRDGVGSIEAMLKQAEIKLMPVGASDLAMYMNQKSVGRFNHINSIYWGVSHASIEGVLDRIRTALVQLVAELRANMKSDETVPSPEVAQNAVNVVVEGKKSRVSVNTAQTSGRASPATATMNPPASDPESRFWNRWRKPGVIVVGIATVAAAVFAAIEVL
jgi:hypothetical protein